MTVSIVMWENMLVQEGVTTYPTATSVRRVCMVIAWAKLHVKTVA